MDLPELSCKDYRNALLSLEQGGSDWATVLGQGGLTTFGMVAGAAAAPTLFAALGFATTTVPATLLGSTTLATLVGMAPVAVTVATPIGWFLALGAGAGVLAYGIGKLLQNGAKQDERRDRNTVDIQNELNQRLEKLKSSWSAMLQNAQTSEDADKYRVIATILREGFDEDIIPMAIGARIVFALAEQTITPDKGMGIVQNMIAGMDGTLSEAEFAHRQALAAFELLTPEERQTYAHLKDMSEEEARKKILAMSKGPSVMDRLIFAGQYAAEVGSDVGGAVYGAAKYAGAAIADGAGYAADAAKVVGGAVADGAGYAGEAAKVVGGALADGAGYAGEAAKVVGGALADGAEVAGKAIAQSGGAVLEKAGSMAKNILNKYSLGKKS